MTTHTTTLSLVDRTRQDFTWSLAPLSSSHTTSPSTSNLQLQPQSSLAKPNSHRPSQQQSSCALLQAPTDILLLIRDHLDPPSSLSLSLTCRATYHLLHTSGHREMSTSDQLRFLNILQGDPLVPGLYTCHLCVKMHPFRNHWGPRSRLEAERSCEKPQPQPYPPQQDPSLPPPQQPSSSSSNNKYHCGKRDRFCPIGNPYKLSFTHAQLVMNRHFYGPRYGIPLRNLCIRYTSLRDVVAIDCQTDARIIDDDLHLHRTYSFTVPKSQVSALRRCTGNRDFRICEHTSLFQNSSVYKQYIPELSRRPWGASCDTGEGLLPCQESSGSCGLCLMDYDVTITTIPNTFSSALTPSSSTPATPLPSPLPLPLLGGYMPFEETYQVTIRTYHDLGRCRTPSDWKWARFTESCRPHLFFPNRPNRRGSTVYPGSVKKQWVGGPLQEPDQQRSGPRDASSKTASRDKHPGFQQSARAAKSTRSALPFEFPKWTVGKVQSKESNRQIILVKAEVLEI